MIFINKRYFLLIKSIILGLFLIGVLIFDGHIERLCIMVVTLVTINVLKSIKLRINPVIVIIFGMCIGYILGNIVLYYSIMIHNNDFQTKKLEKANVKLSKPAVILYSSGEPHIFDYIDILNHIYSKENILEKINAPIETFNYKIAYENIGYSKYFDLCNTIMENLRSRLGNDYDLYFAYFNIEPYIEKEIDRISKDYERIILVPLMLSESKDYNKLKTAIDTKYLKSDINIKNVPFLWESQKLSRQVVEKIFKEIDKEKVYNTGAIFLISDKQSIYEQGTFCRKVIDKMVKLNFQEEKIICLKYNDDEKQIMNSVNILKGKGVNKIIIFSISTLYNDVKHQYKIERLINRIQKNESINILYLSGWGVGENLLNELEYKIRITNLKD